MNLRRLLWIPLSFIAALHGFLAIQWIGRWGFFGAILHWFETFTDPISAAAGLDLLALMSIIFAWIIWREGRWNRTVSLVTIPFIVFPSLSLLFYLIMSDKILPGESSDKA